jgi:hypothetical protein
MSNACIQEQNFPHVNSNFPPFLICQVYCRIPIRMKRIFLTRHRVKLLCIFNNNKISIKKYKYMYCFVKAKSHTQKLFRLCIFVIRNICLIYLCFRKCGAAKIVPQYLRCMFYIYTCAAFY